MRIDRLDDGDRRSDARVSRGGRRSRPRTWSRPSDAVITVVETDPGSRLGHRDRRRPPTGPWTAWECAAGARRLGCSPSSCEPGSGGSDPLDQVLAALADPTRRAVLERLVRTARHGHHPGRRALPMTPGDGQAPAGPGRRRPRGARARRPRGALPRRPRALGRSRAVARRRRCAVGPALGPPGAGGPAGQKAFGRTLTGRDQCGRLRRGRRARRMAAAIELPRAGREVLLIDKADSHVTSAAAMAWTYPPLREVEHLGFEPASVPNCRPVDTACVRSPSGRDARSHYRQIRASYAAVAPRVSSTPPWSTWPGSAASQVQMGTASSRRPTADDGIVIDAEALGHVSSRYVVAADGMRSRAQGPGRGPVDGYLGEWHAFRQYFVDVTGNAADQLCVWFEADLLPGYAGRSRCPTGGPTAVRRAAGRRQAHQGHDGPVGRSCSTRPTSPTAWAPAAHRTASPQGWPIPARVDQAAPAQGPRSSSGDAAGRLRPDHRRGHRPSPTHRHVGGAGHRRGRRHPAGSGRAATRDLAAEEWRPDHRMAAASPACCSTRARAWAPSALPVPAPGRWNFGRWLFEDEARAAALRPRAAGTAASWAATAPTPESPLRR